MKEKSYREWLAQQKYQANTITNQIHRVRRVEDHYGDLDEHYSKDRLAEILDTLTYSMSDMRAGRPNPTKIQIQGDIRANLSSYRDAVKRYVNFIEAASDATLSQTSEEQFAKTKTGGDQDGGQRIGLERDLQAALRTNIELIEKSLQIIDDGAERSVDSGFIDITARDAAGNTVVIELKAGPASRQAVAQILSYMGDIVAEEETKKVRGILIAFEFDSKAKAAARMVPNLSLCKYSVQFSFSDGSA